ncbi:YybH family protein [Shewanella phaeophyticola]|uniref:Nuclear transport factor 2 family protein n=1 Tax=Shewanella phaeophyticola TaxID=2978345 RepID=A0ABT2P3X9_9GAMM|nr:nuclear transport factor 2 family protein [Shewanella sp. KJ10-1]MCT8986390.1 nuclear transport factor 2 family protein [Shewanella sp. KJ10-1]
MTTSNSVAADTVSNKTLNANFTQLADAFEHLDLSSIEQIYTEDAVYISETQDKGIIHGKANIVSLYTRFFDKIKRKQAKLEVDFRVVVRHIDKNTATDIGYYLVRFHPGADSGEPVSEFAGKFVTIFAKDSDDQWRISVDSNTHATAKFYYDAKPVPNLYYGRQFNSSPNIETSTNP